MMGEKLSRRVTPRKKLTKPGLTPGLGGSKGNRALRMASAQAGDYFNPLLLKTNVIKARGAGNESLSITTYQVQWVSPRSYHIFKD